jgi:hypothetical protein
MTIPAHTIANVCFCLPCARHSSIAFENLLQTHVPFCPQPQMAHHALQLNSHVSGQLWSNSMPVTSSLSYCCTHVSSSCHEKPSPSFLSLTSTAPLLLSLRHQVMHSIAGGQQLACMIFKSTVVLPQHKQEPQGFAVYPQTPNTRPPLAWPGGLVTLSLLVESVRAQDNLAFFISNTAPGDLMIPTLLHWSWCTNSIGAQPKLPVGCMPVLN